MGSSQSHHEYFKSRFKRVTSKDQYLACTGIQNTEMIVTKHVVPLAQLEDFKQRLNKAYCIQHANIARIVDSYQNKYWCGGSVFVLIINCPHRTLQDQLDLRKQRGSRFSQIQLWNVLLSCIQAFSHLQQLKEHHQSIKLKYIFVSREIVKVFIPWTLAIDKQKENFYLAPRIKRKNGKISDQQLFKGDVFVMALNIISLGLLQSMDDLYQADAQEPEFNMIDNKLRRLGVRYSRKLVLVLERMLQVAESRPDWKYLKRCFKELDPRVQQKIEESKLNTIEQRQSQSFRLPPQFLDEPVKAKRTIQMRVEP